MLSRAEVVELVLVDFDTVESYSGYSVITMIQDVVFNETMR